MRPLRIKENLGERALRTSMRFTLESLRVSLGTSYATLRSSAYRGRVTFFARAKKDNQRKHAPRLVLLFSYH